MANFHMVNALSMNIKDSRWLQLEVCREYQRNKCSRSDTECKFAHPLPHVEVQNGKVTACFDSIKGRCNREKPPCKYFHPPQHLKEQLLINGRNNLAIKNALMQQFAAGSLPMAGTVPMTSPTAPMYSLPPSMSQFYTAAPTQAVGDAGLVAPLALPQLQQKMQRSDRLEGEPAYDAQVYFGAFPGMGVAYKRSAGDKAGIPCYPAPGAASYQQLMLQQQQQSYLHQTPCNNAHSVTYTDSLGQLLDNLPVCQDFRKGACVRPACKFVHYVPDHVEITSSNQVTVCRDSVRGKCARPRCKYYHLPVLPAGPGEPAASAAALGLHLL
ncbi:protein muscleblind-like isoform X6 [Amphibalanus amphitrite]|uniref:protein muscleblind-like isoform X7 n=1 Tax=Amphibalanus amphitrite TaxID=1232801 RepID=UPI001C904F57|nr:protein muscleblind-like isoform X7 [Amphibalanus amphitrite]XP_043236685.1 protein muscleblind-like isoform X6 [Amphibalanus amphitrite]